MLSETQANGEDPEEKGSEQVAVTPTKDSRLISGRGLLEQLVSEGITVGARL